MFKTTLYITILIVFSFLKANCQEKKAESYFLKGSAFHYTNKDSAYFFYNKSIKESYKEKNYDNLLNTYLYFVNVTGNHFDLQSYSKILKEFDSVVDFVEKEKLSDNISFYKKYISVYQIDYYYDIRDYPSAINVIKKLINRIDSIPKENYKKEDYNILSSAYSYYAIINRKMGKLNFAEDIYKKDISFILKNKDSIIEWDRNLNNSKKLLANVYSQKNDFEKAEKLLKETLDFYIKKENNNRYKNNIISTFKVLAENDILAKKYDKAIHVLIKTKRFFKGENPFSKEFDILKGDAYLGLSKYDSAFIYYQKSLDKTKIYYQNKKNPDIANVYLKIGNLYKKQNNYTEALNYYQKGLIQLDDDFNHYDFNKNPHPESVSSKTILISILKEKLDALNRKYFSTKNIDFLLQAHKTSFTIVKTLDFLKPEFESKIDKKFLIETTYPTIQKMVEISYELYINKNAKTYLDDAFYFIEKSKSILLLEAIRNTEATKFGGIPKNILQKEQHFRAKIAYFEKAIYWQKKGISYKDSLRIVKNNYYDFLNLIEKEYPKYYQLKYNQTIITANQIQQKISKNTSLISFLASGSTLFAISINKKNKYFYKLNYSIKTQENIKKLKQKSAILNLRDTTIYTISNKVYNSILKPILRNEKNKNIIFLNDDLLNYIALDALVTDTSELHFVIEDYIISYDNSATIWMAHQKNKPINKNRLLAFAPTFDKHFFHPLRYNVKEVDGIKNIFESNVFVNEKAALNYFQKNSSNYNLIHLATHAVTNDQFPDYSYLAFSDSTKDTNLLYIKDLYNYQLNADLVTLSACETGVGKLQKGEGMLSLSRAFNYAGTNSLITTLWKIDDQSTSNIITNFYHNLYSGYTKSEAIRQAKLDYLDRNKNDVTLQHPYFWSGIVLSGNVNAIVKKPIYSSVISAALIFGIFIFGIIFINRKLKH